MLCFIRDFLGLSLIPKGQNYQIQIYFYRNIVHKNVSFDMGPSRFFLVRFDKTSVESEHISLIVTVEAMAH